MHLLDDIKEIKKIDQNGMYDLIYQFPSQFEDALGITEAAELPDWRADQRENIVVAGLGGSAIGGDLVRSYLAEKLDLPFFICRNYILPNFVDKSTLVFVSSYSGNTEETLSAYDDAKKRDAKILIISSGGKVKEKALQDKITYVNIPKGFPPRAALGYSFVPIFVMLEKLGFVQGEKDQIRKAKEFLSSNRSKYKMESRIEENFAKRIALELNKKLPIIYAATDHFDAVSTRWKGQICENAKMLAFNNVFPEFNHNELVGWKILSGYKDHLIVVILKDRDDHPRIKRRMEIVKGIIEKEGVKVIEVESCGETLLSRMFSLVQLGDFTSFYLAILNREDPTPVKVIDFLKNELAKGSKG
ncbi:MAG: bifunctional phosphoglucose/phosphomannose isomerase [candidate division Zixibacteria bacterium]|nr:bifunctional phosphoglucose/phosphomannose isomerase [candidate division Zixibacteria bacterium]